MNSQNKLRTHLGQWESFHEKQRKEKLEENRQLSSVSSQSTPEGAVGGAKENYPKPQRMNTRIRQTDVSDINRKQVPHKISERTRNASSG